MTKVLSFFFCLAFAVILSACSRAIVKEPSAEDYFQRGVELMKKKDYKPAAAQFQKAKDEFPFSPLVADAELNVAECQYLQGSYVEAIASFKDFQGMHPTNENIPFVIYRLGLSNLEQSSTIDRDQTTTQNAVDYFKQVLMNYRNSPYAEPAGEKLVQARRSLSEHEFYIGHFYYKHGNLQASLERFGSVLRTYYETETAPKALVYMREAYRRLKQDEKAGLVDKVFAVHYADSPYRGKSVSELETTNGFLPTLSIPFLTKSAKDDAVSQPGLRRDVAMNPFTDELRGFIAFGKGTEPADVRQGLDRNDPLIALLGEVKEDPLGLLAQNYSIDLDNGAGQKEKQGGIRSWFSSISPFSSRPPDLSAPMWNKRATVVMLPGSREEWGAAKNNGQDSVLAEGLLRKDRGSPAAATVAWNLPETQPANGTASDTTWELDQKLGGSGGSNVLAQVTRNAGGVHPSSSISSTNVPADSRPSARLVTVGIYPFRASSPELTGSLTNTVREMISSRVQEGDVILLPQEDKPSSDAVEESARLAGKRSGSDYVLFGVVSKVADWISIDAKLLHVPTARVVSRFGVEGSGGLSGVVPTVVKLANEVNSKLRELERPSLPPSAAVTRSTVPSLTRTPQPQVSIGRSLVTSSPAANPNLWDQAVKENTKQEPPKKGIFASLLAPFRSSSPKEVKQSEGTIIPEIEEKMKNSPTLDQEPEDGERSNASSILKNAWKSIRPF